MARRFPLELAIRTACHVGDDALVDEGETPFCTSCAKPVHDFASLTFDEAVALVAAAKREGRSLCGTLQVRPRDGAVLLADGYVAPESLVKRRWPTLLAASAIGLAACADPVTSDVPVLAPPPVAPAAPAPAPSPMPVAAAPAPPPVAAPPEPVEPVDVEPTAAPTRVNVAANPPKPPAPRPAGGKKPPKHPQLRGDMAL